jgi:Ni,Fe-hydrogenase I cytochrome b subunit
MEIIFSLHNQRHSTKTLIVGAQMILLTILIVLFFILMRKGSKRKSFSNFFNRKRLQQRARPEGIRHRYIFLPK